MEQSMLWVTIIGIIIIPLLGWLLNTLITKRIDDLEGKRLSDNATFFRRLDEDRKIVETEYVRRDLYDQEIKHQTQDNDKAFKGLSDKMDSQFKHVDEKIDGIKALINEKFSHKGG